MKRLLIVDDHAVVRHGLKLACEHNGFQVVASLPTIAEARSAIAALNPQIVVVDINLPDGSGFELIQWIRKINNSLPIVVLSLNDSPEYVRAARSSGANAYVVKSAPIEELIAAKKVDRLELSVTSVTAGEDQVDFKNTLESLVDRDRVFFSDDVKNL